MATSMSGPSAARASRATSGLALGALAFVAFVIGTAELMVVGTLNLIADGTPVSIGTVAVGSLLDGAIISSAGADATVLAATLVCALALPRDLGHAPPRHQHCRAHRYRIDGPCR